MKKIKKVKKYGDRLRKVFNDAKEKRERLNYIDTVGSEQDQKEIDDWNKMFDERD